MTDTQMTETIKCRSLIVEYQKHRSALSVAPSAGLSAPSVGSLKWQCVCGSCAEEECGRRGCSLLVLADSRGFFTTYWRHGRRSHEGCVSINLNDLSTPPSFINLLTSPDAECEHVHVSNLCLYFNIFEVYESGYNQFLHSKRSSF